MRRTATGWLHFTGVSGLFALTTALLVLFATAGLSLLIVLIHVWRAARRTETSRTKPRWVAVAGQSPVQGRVGPDYASRLERAASLARSQGAAGIILLGGQTGKAPVSEAALGRAYLVERGHGDLVLRVEETSIHTLENLRRLRGLIGAETRATLLITSRYHVARCRAMADGLRLGLSVEGAEDRLRLTPRTCIRLLIEAFFLHWYGVGKVVVRLIGYRSALARIS